MSKSRKKKKSPKRVLALPDLEQAKSAVLNTLCSKSGQRTEGDIFAGQLRGDRIAERRQIEGKALDRSS
jgi:hypothetical protein